MSSVPSCGRKNEVSEVKGSSERKKTWGRGAQIPLAIGEKKGRGGITMLSSKTTAKRSSLVLFHTHKTGGSTLSVSLRLFFAQSSNNLLHSLGKALPCYSQPGIFSGWFERKQRGGSGGGINNSP